MNRREFAAQSTLFVTAIFAGRAITSRAAREETFIAAGAKLEKLPVDFGFAEGPVADRRGDVYFSDWAKKRIYRWTEGAGLTVFMENAPGAVGIILPKTGQGNTVEKPCLREVYLRLTEGFNSRNSRHFILHIAAPCLRAFR